MSIRTRQTNSGTRFLVDYYPQGRYGKRARITLPAFIKTKTAARKWEESLKLASQKIPKEITLPAGSIFNKVFPAYLEWYEMHRSPNTFRDICEIYKNHLEKFFGANRIEEINTN